MRIKNWGKFQHFKDRRPPWIKLYRDLLDDIEWHELEPAAAKALVMLWLIASENDGELPSLKVIAFRLRVTEKQAKSIVSSLSHWLEQDDIATISERYHDDLPETETETEEETEKEAETETRASEFDLFWFAYPHKVGKGDARSSFKKARQKASLQEILAGVERYKADKPPDRNWCNPATWLNQERWLDEPGSLAASRKRSASLEMLDNFIGERNANGGPGLRSESTAGDHSHLPPRRAERPRVVFDADDADPDRQANRNDKGHLPPGDRGRGDLQVAAYASPCKRMD